MRDHESFLADPPADDEQAKTSTEEPEMSMTARVVEDLAREISLLTKKHQIELQTAIERFASNSHCKPSRDWVEKDDWQKPSERQAFQRKKTNRSLEHFEEQKPEAERQALQRKKTNRSLANFEEEKVEAERQALQRKKTNRSLVSFEEQKPEAFVVQEEQPADDACWSGSEPSSADLEGLVNVVPMPAGERNWKNGPRRLAVASIAVAKLRKSKTSAEKLENKQSKKNLLKLAPVVEWHDIPWLQRVTTSKTYEYASIVTIVLNSVYIGWQTQFLAARAYEDSQAGLPLQTGTPDGFAVLGVLFNVLFTIDLGMRWKSEGFFEFWRSQDIMWNLLDLMIVIIGLIDLSMQIYLWAGDGEGSDAAEALSKFSVHRMLRIVRVVKVARAIRVMKFFRELRMMVFSILNSMKSLLWVMLVLALLFYVFGISFTSAVTEYLETAEMWNDSEYADLIFYFGSLDRAWVSLYMAIAGGNDWCVYYEALAQVSGLYKMLFLAFVTFSIFAVLNIVTGVFVDSALSANITDRDQLVQEEMDFKKGQLTTMRKIFEELDEDGSGLFSLMEFQERLSDPRVQAYFSTLKLDVTDATALFALLDDDQSNEVSIDEFVSGCYKLQGEARALDAKLMQYEVKNINKTLMTLIDSLKPTLDALTPPDNIAVSRKSTLKL
ncbi:unnamed protein product [Polarella glacialis]|uniref:EF-hand domain-containing protein n=1 Tax=Polarella glacialis TaxID=89957 RepID=A0A813HD84_POLGL|nr:unnamed protein product [Polarella glacialis]